MQIYTHVQKRFGGFIKVVLAREDDQRASVKAGVRVKAAFH